MTTENPLPKRAARVSQEQQTQVVRLALRQHSQAEIARTTGLNPRTVRRILARTRSALRINQETSQDRAEAIATYRLIQREAWQAIDAGRAPAELLGEVRLAQTRIDQLLGLAPASVGDPLLLLSEFKEVVIRVVELEAPELAPRLADRLRAAAAPISVEDEEP
jgi:Homeodomain-like domain